MTRTVQRELNKKQSTPQWGGTNDGSITFNPHAEVVAGGKTEGRWYANSAIEEVEVERGSTGTITIFNPFYWNYHGVTTEAGIIYNSTNHDRRSGGPVDSMISATFVVGKDDKVTFGSPVPNGTTGVPGLLDGELRPAAKDGQDGGSLTNTTILKATQAVTTTATSTKGTTQTASGTVQIGGGVIPAGATGGGSFATAQTASTAVGVTSSGAGVYMGSFGVNLKVKKPPASPAKRATAKIEYDREGRFVSGDKGIMGVRSWWHSLPEGVRDKIVLGEKDVFVYGNATATGTPTKNQYVVGQRIVDVKANLIAITPGMKIRTEDKDTEANERSVIISVTYHPEDEAAAPAP